MICISFCLREGPLQKILPCPKRRRGSCLFKYLVVSITLIHTTLLKDASLREVKIADFGLSEYSRPGECSNNLTPHLFTLFTPPLHTPHTGATLTGPRGTLSFQAPEIFSGSNYSGPPLDVWALGVILFAALTGRLPFEGGELNAPKRPREALIKQKIMACQYKIDSHLSSDAKDLIKRMLRLDPVQRASVPELFGHAWVLPKNSFRITPGTTPSTSFLSPNPGAHPLSNVGGVPAAGATGSSMSLAAAMAVESAAKVVDAAEHTSSQTKNT